MLQSLSIYYRWWKTWGTLPVLAWVRGAALYRAGRFDLAEPYYRLGLDRHPSHPARFSARLDLAFCLFKTNRLTESEEQLKFVTTNAPHLREGYVRLAKLQSWSGRPLEAAWTMRRACKEISIDSEMVALFLLGAVDNAGPSYLIKEASALSSKLDQSSPLLATAISRLHAFQGKTQRARIELSRIASQSNAPIESLLGYADILIEDEQIEDARLVLKRALALNPEHPRVLSSIAQTYLKAGECYNPDYARQLATTGCQNSNWTSPREMHILAESYYHLGDKIGALVIASKAKQAGSRLLGAYRDSKDLDRLIESLSSGTQA